MKKLLKLAVITALILGITTVAEAKRCITCGADISDNANYCPMCKTPQPMGAHLGQQNTNKQPHEVILDMFAFIDNYELYFQDMQYLNVLGKMPEIKTQFNNAGIRYKQLEPMLPEECKHLARLYARKYQLLDGITNVMKNVRLDSGFKAALYKSAMIEMAYCSKIIAQFRQPINWNRENIEILKKQMHNITERTQKYKITSNYLKMDDTKVPAGESIMVLGLIDNKRARVMYMGPTLTYDPLEANFNLTDLAKRTTWKRENEFFFEDIKLKQ